MTKHAETFIANEFDQVTELVATSESLSFNVDSTGLGVYSKVLYVIVVTSHSSANFSVQTQVSPDGTNFVNDPDVSPVSITGNGVFAIKSINHGTRARLVFTRSGGSATFAVYSMRRTL